MYYERKDILELSGQQHVSSDSTEEREVEELKALEELG